MVADEREWRFYYVLHERARRQRQQSKRASVANKSNAARAADRAKRTRGQEHQAQRQDDKSSRALWLGVDTKNKRSDQEGKGSRTRGAVRTPKKTRATEQEAKCGKQEQEGKRIRAKAREQGHHIRSRITRQQQDGKISRALTRTGNQEQQHAQGRQHNGNTTAG